MSEMQKEIGKEMKVKPTIDAKEEIRKSIDFLKGYMQKHPFLESFVLGLSLGQDSTLTGKLAQMAVNELNEEVGEKKYRFIGVRLPYGKQKDEEDAPYVMDFIQPDQLLTVNIKGAVDASVAAIEAAGVQISDFVKGNNKARERMKVQFDIAAMNKGVVLGTDHSAEAVTGFYTKFGDGAADLVPIFRLNKRQGKMLLKELGCPERLYLKAPTADLEDDKPLLPDEVALGFSYDELDDYLEGKQVRPEVAEKIEDRYVKTMHKRMPPISVFEDWWK
ncbi:NAD(+) synthase [Lottiidibacillus patelloidae]|uniref:NH(3)-dependent NAD(+) synthetase n=1 Tax=Lottiidibacillus patelloidae TaxID=2670334 RepID=A0A263BTK5_9BACI|nr:ammonia-dependent NAD(+) synthetase [Lottiidibacillus patelloidae]OZM57005.1 NAD(+) synthase [Lottiidibacillus patelloidae]